jgi:hypothetical protein
MVTHIDPNDRAKQATEKLATIQEDRVSMLEVLKPIPGGLIVAATLTVIDQGWRSRSRTRTTGSHA